jgi:hypothetical protein
VADILVDPTVMNNEKENELFVAIVEIDDAYIGGNQGEAATLQKT